MKHEPNVNLFKLKPFSLSIQESATVRSFCQNTKCKEANSTHVCMMTPAFGLHTVKEPSIYFPKAKIPIAKLHRVVHEDH